MTSGVAVLPVRRSARHPERYTKCHNVSTPSLTEGQPCAKSSRGDHHSAHAKSSLREIRLESEPRRGFRILKPRLTLRRRVAPLRLLRKGHSPKGSELRGFGSRNRGGQGSKIRPPRPRGPSSTLRRRVPPVLRRRTLRRGAGDLFEIPARSSPTEGGGVGRPARGVASYTAHACADLVARASRAAEPMTPPSGESCPGESEGRRSLLV
jgi:hypothetical protein